jgi:hypothetical protein
MSLFSYSWDTFPWMYCTSKYFLKCDVLHPDLSHILLASICGLHLYVCLSVRAYSSINQSLTEAAVTVLITASLQIWWRTERLLSSQEEFSSMELVKFTYEWFFNIFEGSVWFEQIDITAATNYMHNLASNSEQKVLET